jgi:Zn ribbon nucleic-acid-binding protein
MADILFPTLLVFGFFGIIILVGIVFSYVWLRWLYAGATQCPECGQRGGGEMTESKVIDSTAYTQWKETRNIFGQSTKMRRVQVTQTTYVDHFECENCGHQWTQTAKERKQSPI